MYILFINSGGKCDIFFSAQFNNKNCPTHGFNPTQPNPCGLGWVGLNFFLTHYGGLGQKIPSTRPMHTPNNMKWLITPLAHFRHKRTRSTD